MRLYDEALYGLGDGLVGVNFRCRKCGIPQAGLTLSGFLWALGLACWRQLIDVESVVFPRRGSLSMGLEGGLGMGLLASTFDVESVVFPRRG